jgi:hypothetical protein
LIKEYTQLKVTIELQDPKKGLDKINDMTLE